MRQIEMYRIDRKNMPINHTESPYCMAVNISMEDINNFFKSRMSKEDKEKFKSYTVYPIKVYQNMDFSFDVYCGFLK